MNRVPFVSFSKRFYSRNVLGRKAVFFFCTFNATVALNWLNRLVLAHFNYEINLVLVAAFIEKKSHHRCDTQAITNYESERAQANSTRIFLSSSHLYLSKEVQ